MKRLAQFTLWVILALLWPELAAAWTHGVSAGAPFVYVLDTYPASPGAWTSAYSLRQLKSAYGGAAIQLQRSSDSATQDIGFSNGAPDQTTPGMFCSMASLTVGYTSSRVALPAGTQLHIVNTSQYPMFYALGNSSVTATTSSTWLTAYNGTNVAVGANTYVAAITAAPGSTTWTGKLFVSNCGVSIRYDQVNANNLTQATLANQMGYLPGTYTDSGLPVIVGCPTCGMTAADSASYKTGTVEQFSVFGMGLYDWGTGPNFSASVGYPSTTSSDAATMRWGLSNAADLGNIGENINANWNSTNQQGFAGVYRANLWQYDATTSDASIRTNTSVFRSGGGATITYPNVVGLYFGKDAAGHSFRGYYAEDLIASGTQTARNTISTNQSGYWGVSNPPATLTNPLGDGYNWAPGYSAPNNAQYTVNGTVYDSEAAWMGWSQWRATNTTTASGQLGDLWRFDMRPDDIWNGTERSELDGYRTDYPQNTTIWIAYAVYLEPGATVCHSSCSPQNSWNIVGQFHVTSGAICCTFNTMAWAQTGSTEVFETQTYNNSGGTSDYRSPAISRGRWYHFLYKVYMSSSGSADTFDVWLDPVTPRTMSHEIAQSGSLFYAGNIGGSYWKYGIYRGNPPVLVEQAIDYANMQVCSSGADCTAKYGVSDLSALETTPLADQADP